MKKHIASSIVVHGLILLVATYAFVAPTKQKEPKAIEIVAITPPSKPIAVIPPPPPKYSVQPQTNTPPPPTPQVIVANTPIPTATTVPLSEPVVESKPEPKQDVKPEPVVAQNTEPKIEPKLEPKVETKPTPPLPPEFSATQIADAKVAYLGYLYGLINEKKEYPNNAKRLRQMGIVKVRITIESDGNVKDVSLVESSDFALLDKAGTALMESIKKLNKFPKEMTQNSLTITVPIEYKLER